MFGISVQKCWSCANAVPAAENPCPWAMRFEPVPGWVADQVWRKDAQYQKKRKMCSLMRFMIVRFLLMIPMAEACGINASDV